ncbi:MAG: MMPL family transporter [Desulfobacteraceae bacterium]|nr:MMPL family transporter [Desulfobacteraceae bacterium]
MNFFSRLFMLGIHHRWSTLVLLAVVTAVSAAGLPRIRVDTGFRSLIPDEAPGRAVYERIVREFGSDQKTLVYVRDDRLWTLDRLAALRKLHTALENLPFVERVESLFTLRSVKGTEDSVTVQTLLPESFTDPSEIDRIREEALSHPLAVGNFLSRNGTSTALVLTLKETSFGDVNSGDTNRMLEQALDPARSVFEEVFQVGPQRINEALRSVLFQDLKRLGPLSAAVLVTVILALLRSAVAAAIPLVTAGLSILCTFGVMGWTGIPLNILCVMLPSLVIAVGSTEDTHMIATYLQGLDKPSAAGRQASAQFMVRHTALPLVLTVMTTAMGFASNIFSGIGLIRDFALSISFAIVANGVITLLFVPMALSTWGPVRSNTAAAAASVSGLPGVFVRLFRFTNRRFPKTLLAVTAVLCAFFVYQLTKLYVTNDPLSYFQRDFPLLQDIRKLHRNLSGMNVFYVTLEAEEENAFLEPENLKKIEAIQSFMQKQGIFDRTVSLADLLSWVNSGIHGGSADYQTVPNSRELVGQYLLFFHRRDTEGYISHDYRRANIVVRHSVSDSRTLNRHVQELREVAEDIAGEGIKVFVVGENLMINAAADSLMVSQLQSLAALLVLIFLMMSAIFTSLKGGVISLVPNVIPIILMFGLMGMLEIPLNAGTVMVAVITIGIAIDGTIHLFFRYNDLCRRTSDYEHAVDVTVREEATPLVTASLALALGFGILLFSNFTLVAQFGALSAATMLFALFANLLVTPIIMSRTRLVGLYQIMTLSMHREVLRASPLFSGMSDYQMRKSIVISELNEFVRGDLLVEQGTRGRSMYLILQGKAEVRRRSSAGSQVLAVLGPGEIFGEIGYIRETLRTADVRAVTDVEALRFDFDKIAKDLKLFPYIVAHLNLNISSILGERLAEVMDAMDEIVRKPDPSCAPADGSNPE